MRRLQFAAARESDMAYRFPTVRPPHALTWLALSCLVLGGAWVAWAQAADGSRLTLVWADEFDDDGAPNPDRWTFETGFVRNEELQWYQPQNATCRDGLLVIEARRERAVNPQHASGSTDWRRRRPSAEYTSASLTTAGLHAWQYGRWEIKARIDARPGLWPAIWTLGVEGDWPSSGEIDIMEAYGGQLWANAAWGTRQRWVPRWDSASHSIAALGGDSWTSAFHVWRMEWDERRLRIFVDDRLLNTVNLADTRNGGDGRNPFHQPHALLLNLAVGGANGGDPSATSFPARFEVDYVRIYAGTARAPKS